MTNNPILKLLLQLRYPTVTAITLILLLEQGKPLSFKEITEKTGYAKSHISYALKLLEEKGLVERITIKKRHLFTVTSNVISKILIRHLQEIEHLLKDSKNRQCNETNSCLEIKRILEAIGIALKNIKGENGYEK